MKGNDELDVIIEDLIERYKEKIQENYKLVLRKLLKKIHNVYYKLGDNLTTPDMAKYNRLANLERELRNEIKEFHEKNILITENGIRDIHKESYYRTFYYLEAIVGISVGFSLLTNNNQNDIVLSDFDPIGWKNRMGKNTQMFSRQLHQVLETGLKQGDSYIKMSKEFSRVTGLDYNRSKRIIRTEGHRVQILGKLNSLGRFDKAAQRLGIKSKRIWVATLDERTRSSHREIDGQEAKIIDGKLQFTLPSGVHTVGPGLSGFAEEDINCRCTIRVEIDGFKPKNIKYKNYKEWVKEKGDL